MKIHKPQRLEWNLNTIVQLVGLVVLLFTAAGVWFGLRGDVLALKEWRVEHEAEVDRIRADVDLSIGRIADAANLLDRRADASELLVARLTDRLAVAETRGSEMAQSLRDLQSSINQQSGDLKVILSWIAEQRRQEPEPR